MGRDELDNEPRSRREGPRTRQLGAEMISHRDLVAEALEPRGDRLLTEGSVPVNRFIQAVGWGSRQRSKPRENHAHELAFAAVVRPEHRYDCRRANAYE